MLRGNAIALYVQAPVVGHKGSSSKKTAIRTSFPILAISLLFFSTQTESRVVVLVVKQND